MRKKNLQKVTNQPSEIDRWINQNEKNSIFFFSTLKKINSNLPKDNNNGTDRRIYVEQQQDKEKIDLFYTRTSKKEKKTLFKSFFYTKKKIKSNDKMDPNKTKKKLELSTVFN